ncbi:MAG: sulfatase [bacterium]
MENGRFKSSCPVWSLKLVLVVIILFLAQGCKTTNQGLKTSSKARPNIILISVDALRPDHLGCYGYKKHTSPNVDKFAKEGLLFKSCFSHASETGPSCASFLSGFLPHETKVTRNTTRVHSSVPMLADILKQAGYRTCGIVSNYVLRKEQGFEQGFDVYDAQMDERELNRRNVCERIAEKTSECVISILSQHSRENFFLWVHYQDPHGPYTPKPPYDNMFFDPNKEPVYLKFNASFSGRKGIPSYQRLQNNNDYHYYVSQYDGEICYFDEHFGRLVAFLKQIHVYDNSLIVFTADHGESMGEHGCYFSHGHGLTNDLIHVPLIIRYKDMAQGRRKGFVQHLDIVPTILKLVNIKERLPYRGKDLFVEQPDPTIIFSELKRQNFSLISGKLKLLIYGNRAFLFDIQEDFFENKSLTNHILYQNHLYYMVSQVKENKNEDLLGLDTSTIDEKPRLTEEEKERLRSLGYIAVGQ